MAGHEHGRLACRFFQADGAIATEYAILVMLVALAIVGAVSLFGGAVLRLFTSFLEQHPFG